MPQPKPVVVWIAPQQGLTVRAFPFLHKCYLLIRESPSDLTFPGLMQTWVPGLYQQQIVQSDTNDRKDRCDSGARKVRYLGRCRPSPNSHHVESNLLNESHTSAKWFIFQQRIKRNYMYRPTAQYSGFFSFFVLKATNKIDNGKSSPIFFLRRLFCLKLCSYFNYKNILLFPSQGKEFYVVSAPRIQFCFCPFKQQTQNQRHHFWI